MKRVRKLRCDRTILSEADIDNMKEDYYKNGLNFLGICKKYHIGASRLSNIINKEKNEIGGFVDRQAGEVESEPPPPVANQAIDSRLLDDIADEAEKSLEQLEQRRWQRVRGAGGLMRSQ